MTVATLSTELDFYRAHGAALFPIPAGSKAPHGLVPSFKHDFSRDPAQWLAWQTEHPGCNFGVVAFASQWIILDIDTSGGEEGRAEAWQTWSDLCKSWGLPGPLSVHVESARGGWHAYFSVPPHIDAGTLRQPDAIKKRINVRCIGYTVAAGSFYDGTARGEQSGPYLLFPDAAPPHPAPDALIAHCTRADRVTVAKIGTMDRGDVAALLQWLNEHEAFAAYEDWVAAGMACKLEFGDDGEQLWAVCHDGSVTADVAATKWGSFATEPTSQSVTLNSFMKRAHALGWTGSIRPSTNAMFSGVAQIAAQAGAKLHSAIPMMGRGQKQTECGEAILVNFLAATSEHGLSADCPLLPDSLDGGHGLYDLLNQSIRRTVAISESGSFPDTAIVPLGILENVHPDVKEAVCKRLESLGHTLPHWEIKNAANAFSNTVERALVTFTDWKRDHKGEIQHDNSDNCIVFLTQLSLKLRWNAWNERMEIKGGVDSELHWPAWTYIDDNMMARLRTRGNRTEIRFRPSKEFFWESLLSLAHLNTVDPVRDLLDKLAAEWDGKPRLDSWLQTHCGVPQDAYHVAVGRSLIGGMVMRIRHPGIKFDTMPIFFGRQGTGKSSMLAILAMDPEYFSDSILLGDASKELVLSLAGKTLVEISEMGMRNSANISHVKAMLSRATDAGRTAYARSVTERPRRNIFCGSTNEDSPLVDDENRRFLPVRIDRHVDLEGLRRDVFQLVGEAAALEAQGAEFALPRSVWSEAAEHQEAARAVSNAEVLITDWFAPTEYTSGVSYIIAADLVYLSTICKWTGPKGELMKKMGFRSILPEIHGKRTRVWVRGECAAAAVAKVGVRYLVSQTQDGRPQVTIRAGTGPMLPPLPY